ncbi:MAG: DNA-processing protein DprA [Pseudohongiellaceae bacterium]
MSTPPTEPTQPTEPMQPAQLQRMYLQLVLHGTPNQARLMAQLRHCGGLEQLQQELESGQLPGLPATIGQMMRPDRPNHPALDAHLHWAEQPGNTIICYEDAAYPPRLREIDCPPPLLFVSGDWQLLHHKQVAVVGSRRATSYGLRNTTRLVRGLIDANLTITSGLARGIDGKAHQAALDAGGLTVAVIATGADECYPHNHQSLARRISEEGVLITEFPLGTIPAAYNFPRRNRIISGLALGTLVVEAHPRSGSLITARLALDQNREVFAVPGPISMRSSEGCHNLIKTGARLVASAEDILEDLGLLSRPDQTSTGQATNNETLTPDEQALLTRIDLEGSVIEHIMHGGNQSFGELQSILLSLELKGHIECLGGRYYRVG